MKPRPSQQDQDIRSLLDALKSASGDYPQELLAKRRAALMEKLRLLEKPGVKESQSLDEEAIIEVLEGLRHVRANYPPLLLAKQRAAFLDQIAKHRRPGWRETFTPAILNWFAQKAKPVLLSLTSDIRRSLIVVSLLVAAFAGVMIYGKDNGLTAFSGIHLTQREMPQPGLVLPNSSSQITKTACTPDSPSAPCLTHGFAESPDQTSWVSNTANSWIKIDIGQTARINKVELDRKYSGGSTGDFTISVAQSEGQYKEVYNSKSDHAALPLVGLETVQVSFEPMLARYVKVTVDDPGTVINEVRAFSVSVPPTRDQTIEDTLVLTSPTAMPSSTPLPTSTPAPTDIPQPTDTRWPTDTPVPTSTPAPTDTPQPTDTRWPTDTPVPTSTPAPTDTPQPTDTRWPTDTPVPIQPTSQSEYISPG